jgi:hypothetical protein
MLSHALPGGIEVSSGSAGMRSWLALSMVVSLVGAVFSTKLFLMRWPMANVFRHDENAAAREPSSVIFLLFAGAILLFPLQINGMPNIIAIVTGLFA